MGHQDNRKNDSRDNITQNHLQKGHIPSVSHRRHADNRQRTGLRCDNRETNAPPWDILTAQKVVARIALILAKPNTQHHYPKQVTQYDDPIARAEIGVHLKSHGSQSPNSDWKPRREDKVRYRESWRSDAWSV